MTHTRDELVRQYPTHPPQHRAKALLTPAQWDAVSYAMEVTYPEWTENASFTVGHVLYAMEGMQAIHEDNRSTGDLTKSGASAWGVRTGQPTKHTPTRTAPRVPTVTTTHRRTTP